MTQVYMMYWYLPETAKSLRPWPWVQHVRNLTMTLSESLESYREGDEKVVTFQTTAEWRKEGCNRKIWYEIRLKFYNSWARCGAELIHCCVLPHLAMQDSFWDASLKFQNLSMSKKDTVCQQLCVYCIILHHSWDRCKVIPFLTKNRTLLHHLSFNRG